MFVWEEKSIDWYNRASLFSSYHKSIVDNLLEILRDDFIVYDLGCGLGYLDIEIAKYVKKVVCIDINHQAVKYLRKQCEEKNIENIEVIQGDWKDWTPNQSADLVILSYCNGMVNDFNKISSLSKKKILSILQNDNNGKNFNVHNHVNLEVQFKRRETSKHVMTYLECKGIDFDYKNLKLDFGQPLDSVAEAREFINYYFKFDNDLLLDNYISINLKKNDSFYYLSNEKNIGLITINSYKEV